MMSCNASDPLGVLTKNPYYTKYSDKIEKMKNMNPDEFQAKLADSISKKDSSRLSGMWKNL